MVKDVIISALMSSGLIIVFKKVKSSSSVFPQALVPHSDHIMLGNYD